MLSLQYQLGEAARLAAESQEDKGKSRKLLREARGYYGNAARGFNEHQADARLKLVELNAASGETQVAAETFEEAYQVGSLAVSAMFAARMAADASGDNNPDAKGELLDQLQQERQNAQRAFELALGMIDAETPIERVNEVRKNLSYLYYEQEDFLRTAALAEFVATKHPSDPSAEAAAKLAMAAFEQLYQSAATAEVASTNNNAEKQFASDHLAELSEFITRRWAGKPLADRAFGILLANAIREDRLDEARGVLQGVPPERRAPLELKLAVASWENAARSAASKEPQAEKLKQSAAAQLAEVVEAARKSKTITRSSATAALYLAQAKLGDGDAAGVLKILEDKTLGPLSLVANKAAAVTGREGFATQAYLTALQAYLSIVPPRTPDAMAMMGKLEKEVGPGQSLTRTYFSLGVQLQRQVEALQAAGKRADAQRVSEAFAEFIARIGDASTQDGGDWTMQQWMAQTYLKLGEGLADKRGGDPAKANQFFQRARDGFQSLLDRAAKDPAAAPSPNSVLAVRMQLGNSQLQLGKHQEAIDTFAALLQEREMMLDVQKAAAYVFQEWGATGDSAQLTSAIRGAIPSEETGKNVIWGWNKLAAVSGKAARKQPKYRDLFFESWLNVATSRYLLGMQSSGAKQAKQFGSARNTILLLSRQYSDLGGAERRGQFDALLKKIQQAEGKKPNGLAEFASGGSSSNQ